MSQPIGTIWCAVCELGKGGVFKLKTEISIDQKLNHVRNCSSIKVTYRISIFQLKVREDTQNEDTKKKKKTCHSTNYHKIFNKIGT